MQFGLRINYVKTHPVFLNTTSVVRKWARESALFGVTGGIIQIVSKKQIVTVISVLFILRIKFIYGYLFMLLYDFH